MTHLVGGSAPDFGGADAAFRGVVTDLLKADRSEGAQSGADKVQGGTLEQLGYSCTIENPRDRIVFGEGYGVDLKVAVARFVWMISGNNRLADIAFYEPKVKAFTDDNIIVPGSSYGLRMRQAFPGVDQLRGIITRLKEDRATRRAAISVYQPTDATRESRDIPCTFGLMFHSRNDRLVTQTIMRSNNAWGLLPFNLFEFSLLAEVVAAEANLEMGPLLHYAGSMHIYERDVEKARALAALPASPKLMPMDAMPRSPQPLQEIEALVAFEADLRHGSSSLRADNVGEWIDRARSNLSPYWQQLAFILVAAVADRNEDRPAIDKVMNVLNPEYAGIIRFRTTASDLVSQLVVPAREPDLFSAGVQTNVVPITRTRLAGRFLELASQHEMTTGVPIGAQVLLNVQARFFDRLAARGAEEVLSEEEFKAALAEAQHDK